MLITISCIDPENKKPCEVSFFGYETIVFKKVIDEKDENKDQYWILLVPENKWYILPEQEWNNHMFEADDTEEEIEEEDEPEDDFRPQFEPGE